jgi:hypothetical protein
VRPLLSLVLVAVVLAGTAGGGYWLHVPALHAWQSQVYSSFLVAGWFLFGRLVGRAGAQAKEAKREPVAGRGDRG